MTPAGLRRILLALSTVVAASTGGCEKRFKPAAVDAPFGTYYELFAGERLGYGVCARDLVAYRAVIAHVPCLERGVVFTVELFVAPDAPPERWRKLIASARCVQPGAEAQGVNINAKIR